MYMGRDYRRVSVTRFPTARRCLQHNRLSLQIGEEQGYYACRQVAGVCPMLP